MPITIRHFIEKINTKTNFTGLIQYNEYLSKHTTFKVGGPADVWIQPNSDAFLEYTAILLDEAKQEGIPVFVLGGGANIVVSDIGIRGIVLDTGGWRGSTSTESSITFLSGTPIDEASELAASQEMGGLEFLAGMPGTIGGAVLMNARCYERSVSDCLVETDILDERQNLASVPFCAEEFGYKKSPFQNRDILILAATFAVQGKNAMENRMFNRASNVQFNRTEMEAHRKDRENKGHYRFPCAGSVFKNNRAFGKPTGKIIDELGLCGKACGGAMVAPFHGNIIINTGNATASDIRRLVEDIKEQVKGKFGLDLETEIIFVGG
jgi:UDP-N-acetylmuramate dehydrogenase